MKACTSKLNCEPNPKLKPSCKLIDAGLCVVCTEQSRGEQKETKETEGNECEYVLADKAEAVYLG